MILKKVISGGQTGVDRAALVVAKQCGLTTGGWMPKDYLALDGNHPEFATEYAVQETTATDYPTRTTLNVRDSDATIRIAYNFNTPTEKCTLAAIRKHNRPYLDVDLNTTTPADVAQWIVANKVKVLNIGGNVERKKPNNIEEPATKFLGEVFALLQKA